MRSPHRDANADHRRGASRPWGLAVPILLALATGCVTQQVPRVVEGEQALKELRGQEPPAPAPAPGPRRRTAHPLPRPGNPRRRAPRSRRSLRTNPRAGPRSPRHATPRPSGPRSARRRPPPAAGGSPPASRSRSVWSPRPPRASTPSTWSRRCGWRTSVNPTINRARTEVLEALALQLAARTLLVPSLNYGPSYHGHNGPLQRSAGKILETSLQSFFVAPAATWMSPARRASPA